MKTRISLWLAQNLSSLADERWADQRRTKDAEMGRIVFDGGSRLRVLKWMLALGLVFSAGVAFAQPEKGLGGILLAVVLILWVLNSKLEEYARKVL